MDSQSRIGDYEILEELGRGGMGRVYKVRNVISDRIEAMKVLLPDLVGRDDLAARFVREIKVLAALHHPHIASLRTALTADNQLVMIMEFVDGTSLANHVRQGPIPVRDALSYLDQALDALAYAHAQGVVHRDIKPANMMLTPNGVVKITDFGIARSRNDQTLTVAGTTTGSLSYMSPEQINGEQTDARSDLYSIGISLYEMVTGERPFRADSDFGVMIAHLKEQPRQPIELLPALGAELNAIIMKSISKDPKERYQSASEFREALRSLSPIASQTSIETGAAVLPSAMATQLVATPAPASSRTAVTAPPAFASSSPAPSAGDATIVQPSRASASGVPPVPAVPPVPSAGVELPVAASAAAVPVVPLAAAPVVTPPMIPAAAAMAAPPAKQGHPAVYVVLGGVLVLTAIVGAGLYIGRANADPGPGSTPAVTPAPGASTSPAGSAPAAVTPPESPAPPPASAAAAAPGGPATSSAVESAVPTPPNSPAATSSVAPPTATAPGASALASPASSTASASAPSSGASTSSASKPAAVPPAAKQQPAAAETASRPAPTPPVAPAPPSPSAAGTGRPVAPPAQPAIAFDVIEDEIDQLYTRASALDQAITTLQQEQSRSGYGLRGDIVQRREQMKLNLQRAQEAVSQRNLARAERFRDLLTADIEVLEKFLGR